MIIIDKEIDISEEQVYIQEKIIIVALVNITLNRHIYRAISQHLVQEMTHDIMRGLTALKNIGMINVIYDLKIEDTTEEYFRGLDECRNEIEREAYEKSTSLLKITII